MRVQSPPQHSPEMKLLRHITTTNPTPAHPMALHAISMRCHHCSALIFKDKNDSQQGDFTPFARARCLWVRQAGRRGSAVWLSCPKGAVLPVELTNLALHRGTKERRTPTKTKHNTKLWDARLAWRRSCHPSVGRVPSNYHLCSLQFDVETKKSIPA